MESYTQPNPNNSYPIYEGLRSGNEYRIDPLTGGAILIDPENGAELLNFLSIDELKSQTNDFMQKFVDMAETDTLPETIFFMDRSARPVGKMFDELFKYYCPDSKMPYTTYLSISGRWSSKKRPDSQPLDKNDPQAPSIINEVFGPDINQKGKILLVDEFSFPGESYGKSIESNKEILLKAFPESEISTETVYTKLPNWYNKTEYLGYDTFQKKDFEERAFEIQNSKYTTNLSLDQITNNESELFDLEDIKERNDFENILKEISAKTPFTKPVKMNEQDKVYYEKAQEELELICKDIRETYLNKANTEAPLESAFN